MVRYRFKCAYHNDEVQTWTLLEMCRQWLLPSLKPALLGKSIGKLAFRTDRP